MAYRRLFQEFSHANSEESSDNEDPLHHVKFIEPSRPRVVTNKVHPASTDFSLDTFSQYLQGELREKRLKQERLRLNPGLAAAEADKERLYALVNSTRSIQATTSKGRLDVRVAQRGRSFSTPASEGDNESRPQRESNGSSSRSNKSSVGDRIKGWAPRKRKSMSNSEALLLNESIESLSPHYSQTSTPTTQAITIAAGQVTDPNRRSVDSVRRSCRIESQILSKEALQRSLSFERHAEEVRNSVRSFEESATHSLPTQNWHVLPSVRRPWAGSTEVITGGIDRGLNIPRITSRTLLTSTHDAAENFDLFNDTSANIEQLFDFACEDEAYANDAAMALDHDISVIAGSDDQSKDCKQFKSRTPVQSSILARKSSATRRPLTGRDTFFTASSDSQDDTSSDRDTPDRQPLEHEGTENSKHNPSQSLKKEDRDSAEISLFDYNDVIPEVLPDDIRQARENCNKIWSLVGCDDKGQPNVAQSTSWFNTQYSLDDLNPGTSNILGTYNFSGIYPRQWDAIDLPKGLKDPPHCHPPSQNLGFPEEVLPLICHYLSSQEVRNLRLVNRATASSLLPLMIRSTVIDFGPSLFSGTDGKDWDRKTNTPALHSIPQSYGPSINKFGMCFDFDPVGLASAETKVIEEEVDAWFGTYVWPKATYPRFSQLKEVEDLIDGNRPLLRNTMKNLYNVSELAISVDSGHGWLNGPDISDIALFKQRQQGGSVVFGKKFDAPDRWNEFALRQYFKMGQRNTLNAYKKYLVSTRDAATFKKIDRKILRRIQLREYDDYAVQSEQPDFNRGAHTGQTTNPTAQHNGGQGTGQLALAPAAPAMVAPVIPAIAHNQPAPFTWSTIMHHQPFTNMNQLNMPGHGLPLAPLGGAAYFPGALQPATTFGALLPQAVTQPSARRPSRVRQQRRQMKETESDQKPILPQWPLLFSGYNLTAQIGGSQSIVQDEIAAPAKFPYLPGVLTEAQVQWLMETVWAQRSFLSAYTNSVIVNAGAFKNVHSFHVAKLSSGLISSLAQKEFWSSLPNLKNVTLKVIPDWRQEHVLGDKFYHRNMRISPVQASVKLAHLLENFIANIENLSVLRIGFVGGGEHQTGMFGRNRHVLPAPISSDPLAWLSDHEVKPDHRTIFAFNHIRDLTFENCWFSPCMLETFMQKSKDTSLHHLTLDSVSMTGVHDTRNDGPLSTEGHNLRCEFSPSDWLHETIPKNACWVNVLEHMTPGKTILDRKYDAEMMDENLTPRPEPVFRGNIKKITLKSCGYVRIMGARSDRFSQNGLVDQGNPWYSLDAGLEARRKAFYMSNTQETNTEPSDLNHQRTSFLRRSLEDESKETPKVCIMMSNRDPDSRSENFGLGKLTQCVHPVEKRILERAWGLRFGWGDDMERWAAVEDGWFEGGTGRFGGTIARDCED